MQVPGVNGGITSIDQHEDKTWTPVVGSAATATKPLTQDTVSIAAYVKSIRDKRKDS